jgi:hypothetical protein
MALRSSTASPQKDVANNVRRMAIDLEPFEGGMIL